MNIAAHKAILKALRQAGVTAGQSFTRLEFLDVVAHLRGDPDVLDEALTELIQDVQFIHAEDVQQGPYVLTEDGYRASLNDW